MLGGVQLDAAALTPRERIDAILLWSALPGASRHHWGTDLDLDRSHGERSGLSDQADAARSLRRAGRSRGSTDGSTMHAPRFGFFRPFQGVRSGVQPEPWHFSFAPIAEQARQRLSPQVLRTAIAGAPLLGKDVVLEHLDELHARYVAAIDLP